MTKQAKPAQHTVNVREIVDKYQENCDRISEIADLCEKEKRERSDAETKEFDSLVRENQILSMRLQAAAADHLREHPNAHKDAEKIIRENTAKGARTEIVFVREGNFMMVADMADSAVIPLNVQDFITPLIEGFILHKVGLPFATGLAGDFVWPTYEMVEATVLEEAAELVDTKIPFHKLRAQPARIGIKIPVTNQALVNTVGILERIIKEIMPAAVRILLNKILFSTKPVNQVARTSGLVGPFVKAALTAVKLSNVPTAEELNADMKAAVLDTGIDGEHLCWIMSKAMEAILQVTPVNKEGVFLPMIQNGYLLGLPVYTSNTICDTTKHIKKYNGTNWADYTLGENDVVKYKVYGTTIAKAIAKISDPASGDIAEVNQRTENIGLGDWRYQPMGLFGTIRFLIDPYTSGARDMVNFILNCDYATKTLREEAFILGRAAVE